MGKSYKCEQAEKTIHFLPDAIKFCCTGVEGPGLKTNDINSLNLKKAEEKRLSILNSLMRGNIPAECTGCTEYKECGSPGLRELIFGKKNTKKINKIIINNFKDCECNCIYCAQKIIYPGDIKEYKILPIIKELYSNSSLSDDLEVEFQGGSVGVWEEFVPVAEELEKHNCKRINILSNGIKYEPVLEEIAKKSWITMCISLDCGSAEKYKEIKNSNMFDTVIENICKYIRAGITVNLKYILLKGINDYPEEISKFLDTARAFGCPVIFDLDYRDVYFGNGNSYVMPENYNDICNTIKQYCSQYNMVLIFNEELRKRLNIQ